MAHFFTKLIALSSGQRHPPFGQLGPGYFLLNIYMMSEPQDYFILVLNVGTKNTHTRHISFFSEPHYIGQEANNISTNIHDQLRQQCPPRVSFGKEGKKKIMRYLDKIHPGWGCILTYTGHQYYQRSASTFLFSFVSYSNFFRRYM